MAKKAPGIAKLASNVEGILAGHSSSRLKIYGELIDRKILWYGCQKLAVLMAFARNKTAAIVGRESN
jgi:hypothetical protein